MSRRRFSPRKFKSLRLGAGLDEAQVDEALELPTGTCARWEADGTDPGIDEALACADLFECDVMDFTAACPNGKAASR